MRASSLTRLARVNVAAATALAMMAGGLASAPVAAAAGVAAPTSRAYEAPVAGYLDIAAHGQLDGVSGTWSVPSISTGKVGYSTISVGIDGGSTAYDIQAGTEQDWGPAGLVYFAWYRDNGGAPVKLGQVFPGDSVQVAISHHGVGAWTLDIKDATSGKSWTGAVSSTAKGRTADWVVEAPWMYGAAAPAHSPLADFGTVQFSHLAATGPGAKAARALPLYLAAPANGPVEAFPTAYDGQTDSFRVTFGNTALVPLPVAALSAPTAAPPPLPSPPPTAGRPATGPGYFLGAPDGGVFAYGADHFAGAASGAEDLAGQSASPGALAAQLAGGALGGPVAAMATTPDKGGYWMMTTTGGVFSFGDAQWYGSLTAMGGVSVPMSAMAPTPDGRGYWLVSLTGGVYSFGDARFAGSCTPSICAFLAVGMVASSSGRGYWLLLQNCEMVPFGDAPHIADTDCQTAAGTTFTPATWAVPTPDRQGYWVMLADGTVFAEGDATSFGTWPATAQSIPGDLAVALLPTPDDRGAWLVYASGYVEDLGDAADLGDLEATVLQAPVVTAAN
ncbi:MAG TPA: G1 family glutamic endopeptidase [Acidimicrobiales bacterium]|nr:G1 family glutamic endopeptidase [Acidimicrobiales bacterium]